VADHSVLDSARSIVIPEAKNRLLVQMAILQTLLK
jgi:ornithine carbamoyltransferase